ncbi:MAG: M23 family metallopeptidase [Bacteroidetes bacterium]|nr:M23 family metallopeptidase [Bacteroidota bacterium]
MFKIIPALITGLFSQFGLGQDQFPKNYFRSPIDSVIVLAGNFAELRPNHFHGGLDIKTGNREGMPIRSVADGYVSRIKVSTHGYGKVIYITHPNGYVSVYAHLRSFSDTIAAFVKQQQYSQKSFEVELLPKAGEFEVKQGDIIAFSGNTGHSGGPHLHFEIRDEKTEKTINPLLFGLPVKDNVKPHLLKIKIYPADENALINGKNKAISHPVKATKSGYKLALADTTIVSGNIYFGFEGYDTESVRGGKNGIYSAELQLNKKRLYYHEMNVIGFEETRCINSLIDYPDNRNSGNFIQRSCVDPNNKLGIYKDVVNKGILFFNSDSLYQVKYIVKDIFGNISYVEFYVRSKRNKSLPVKVSDNSNPAAVLHCREANKFATEGFRIDLPANILYDDVNFKYHSTKANIPGCYSDIYHIHTADVPVHDFFSISIVPQPVNDSLKKLLTLARINKKGKKEFAGGEWQNGSVTARVKEFGDYVVVSDTIPPSIKPLNISQGKNITKQKNIEVKVNDNFSGIKHFEAYIDGNWILMEYEHKKNSLTYAIDTTKQYSPFDTKSRTHLFKLTVSDGVGNTQTYSVTLSK